MKLSRYNPWLPDQVIAFLKSLIAARPGLKILEFGCGGSTVWFAGFNVKVISVEHDEQWHNAVRDELALKKRTNIDLRLRSLPYNGICDEFPDESFDLILVDGEDRPMCLLKAMAKVKKGGVLMLDNAERMPPKFLESLAGWEEHLVHQIGPDSLGFADPLWTTKWWVKP